MPIPFHAVRVGCKYPAEYSPYGWGRRVRLSIARPKSSQDLSRLGGLGARLNIYTLRGAQVLSIGFPDYLAESGRRCVELAVAVPGEQAPK